ncbi:MAG TPA: tRNA (adenosine(37)-N6)-dimethylallyltransferase MiaA [Acidobacteriota bacterium]|nr:tRNA (adenosine(37)-N6)-dimethylallyltransferase MiaA [Acidobacteriota bacterium]
MTTSPTQSEQLRLLAIVGATASGKNHIAQAVADRTGATLLSVDSRKVYRGLNIGTAKPSADIQERFDYAMIDCADPAETFSAGRFTREARRIVAERLAAGRPVILVGGTGFYLEAFRNGLADLPPTDLDLRATILAEAERDGWSALYDDLKQADPEFASGIEPTDKTRILRGLALYRQTGESPSRLLRERRPEPAPWPLLVLAVDRPRAALYQRIEERTRQMIAAGLFDEVRNLLTAGISPELPGMQSVGYPESVDFLAGRISAEEAAVRITRNTRRYAKRQLTWFRHRSYARPIVPEGSVLQHITELWRSN